MFSAEKLISAGRVDMWYISLPLILLNGWGWLAYSHNCHRSLGSVFRADALPSGVAF